MKIKKIIISLLILIVINNIFTLNFVRAADIINSADSFLNKGSESNLINQTALKTTSNEIYNILLGIGIVVAVVVGAFLGVQFIMESADGKAKVSEALIPYVVGCIVVFGAFTIWKVAINMGTSISGSGTINVAQSVGHEIAEGNIEPTSLSDTELKAQYSAQVIQSELDSLMFGDNRNPSKPRNGTQYMTLSEAISNLSAYKQKIYNECKTRGLLKSDGYSLKLERIHGEASGSF